MNKRFIVLIIVLATIVALLLYDRNSPLLEAVKSGDIQKVELIIDENPELVNKRSSDESNKSPLSIAIDNGEKTMVKVLLDAGADPNLLVYVGESALIRAATKGDVAIAKLLIEKGALVNSPSTSFETPLIAASERSSPEMISLLVQAGADVNMVKKAGRGNSNIIIVYSPLKAAAEYGNLEAMKLLLDLGADTNLKGPNDDAAIHVAINGHFIEDTHINALKLMLEKGANINERGYQAKTPLHLAAEGMLLYRHGQEEPFYRPVDLKIVEFIINNGADINAKDDNDLTPIQYAKKNGHVAIVNLLRKHSAQE